MNSYNGVLRVVPHRWKAKTSSPAFYLVPLLETNSALEEDKLLAAVRRRRRRRISEIIEQAARRELLYARRGYTGIHQSHLVPFFAPLVDDSRPSFNEPRRTRVARPSLVSPTFKRSSSNEINIRPASNSSRRRRLCRRGVSASFVTSFLQASRAPTCTQPSAYVGARDRLLWPLEPEAGDKAGDDPPPCGYANIEP